MPTLPPELASILLAFCPLFSCRVWKSAHVLFIGAILAPGKRTVSSALRVMGLGDEQHFQNYHRVLNRAAWSCRKASLILVRMLVAAFAPEGPLVLGLDDTIERRWGGKIEARGIYRDPVRSSDSHFVKTSGLRWLSLMLLADIPWAARVWALPFLTVLAPSETPHRLGPPNRAPGTAVVSYPHSGGGSRRSLRLTAIAVGLGCTATTYYWHHSPALGCTFVPPCTAAQERDQGPSTPGRIASPCSATGPDSPQDGLAVVDGFQLVWRRSTSSRNRFRHRGLVSHWSAASAHPLGVGARPQRQVRNPRSALHPTRSESQSNLAMVPLALASRGDLPRSPGSSGSRDTTPVVPPGDCPHHTCVARLVLRHYFVGSSPGVCERTLHSPSRLVPKDATNLFRRHCADTRATLGPLEFPHIPSPPACNQNPALAVFQLVPGGLLCSLMDKVELRRCSSSVLPIITAAASLKP